MPIALVVAATLLCYVYVVVLRARRRAATPVDTSDIQHISALMPPVPPGNTNTAADAARAAAELHSKMQAVKSKMAAAALAAQWRSDKRTLLQKTTAAPELHSRLHAGDHEIAYSSNLQEDIVYPSAPVWSGAGAARAVEWQPLPSRPLDTSVSVTPLLYSGAPLEPYVYVDPTNASTQEFIHSGSRVGETHNLPGYAPSTRFDPYGQL